MIKNWQLLFCLILLSISCGQKSNPTSTENKVETNVKVETPTSNIDFNGKKLGFIAQEMGREINTLGSKANHSEIQKLVVEMKDDLEKIKEQTLNVL